MKALKARCERGRASVSEGKRGAWCTTPNYKPHTNSGGQHTAAEKSLLLLNQVYVLRT